MLRSYHKNIPLRIKQMKLIKIYDINESYILITLLNFEMNYKINRRL